MNKIFLIFIIGISLSGCATFSKYEWVAGKLCFSHTNKKCADRSLELIRQINSEGKDCYLVWGTYCLKKHAWVEYEGKLLDPTQMADSPALYKEEGRKFCKGG